MAEILDGDSGGGGDGSSKSLYRSLKGFGRAIVVSAQIITGSLVLGIILGILPVLYVIIWLKYKWYVIQRERVIRGLQSKDKESLNDVQVRRDLIQSGPCRNQKSQYMMREITLSTRFLGRDASLSLKLESRTLSNYSGTYTLACDVMNITEEKDIVEIINFANANELGIRAMGSLFSWPDIITPRERNEKSGIVLDMKNYNEMVKVLVLPENEKQSDGTVALVSVQAGMKVWQLCNLLESLGYALPVLGNVTGQSVGGVISTGTHGKNKRFGTLSSIVQSMRLVLANGSIKNIALRDESGKIVMEPYAFAAGVSLGLLGVISTVTLRVVPKHRLSFVIKNMSFATFIDSYKEIIEGTEHAAFIYFPFVDHVRVELSKKLTKEEETKLKDKPMPRHNRTKLFFATILNYVLYESLFGNIFGPVVWIITRYITLCDLESGASARKPAIDKSFKVIACNVDFDIEHHEMEYGYDASM